MCEIQCSYEDVVSILRIEFGSVFRRDAETSETHPGIRRSLVGGASHHFVSCIEYLISTETIYPDLTKSMSPDPLHIY